VLQRGIKTAGIQITSFGNRITSLKEIFSPSICWPQKRIHNKLVEAGIVEKVEEYIYSSARDYYGKQCGLLKIEFLVVKPLLCTS